ncbi:uncharacterized protein LOC132724064 [Ruditapes philippinarum]|uniref:uncharacterized protein LOC132724064 n=1 Tax=Ruditapes philippinarum TaxID=129788 RepID=UPI00295BD480|nr:uncharacterized protein LOC132724064 [Ruditapes philippinarum]
MPDDQMQEGRANMTTDPIVSSNHNALEHSGVLSPSVSSPCSSSSQCVQIAIDTQENQVEVVHAETFSGDISQEPQNVLDLEDPKVLLDLIAINYSSRAAG